MYAKRISLHTMLLTKEKLDEPIRFIGDIPRMDQASQKELESKLQKLEADIAASQDEQEDVTERVIKWMRRDKLYEFQCKGHEEQYRVNLKVADHMVTTTSSSPNTKIMNVPITVS